MLSDREHRARVLRRDLAEAQAARDADMLRLATEASERDRRRREEIHAIAAAAAER